MERSDVIDTMGKLKLYLRHALERHCWVISAISAWSI